MSGCQDVRMWLEIIHWMLSYAEHPMLDVPACCMYAWDDAYHIISYHMLLMCRRKKMNQNWIHFLLNHIFGRITTFLFYDYETWYVRASVSCYDMIRHHQQQGDTYKQQH